MLMDKNADNGINVFNSLYDEKDLTIKKAGAFDELMEMFYAGNFCSTSKSEIELKMFSIFMDGMIDKFKIGEDGLDDSACSDYNIGKMLGIPQEKVRTLKIKKQARYPREFDWKKSLELIKDDIVYDSVKKKIIIPIRDPNLYNEIRNFIEDQGGYIEIQRGNNRIQIRPEYFFILLYKAVDEESDREKIRNEFAKKLRERNESEDIDNILTEKEMFEKALSYDGNRFELIKEILKNIQNPLVGIISCAQVLYEDKKRSNFEKSKAR